MYNLRHFEAGKFIQVSYIYCVPFFSEVCVHFLLLVDLKHALHCVEEIMTSVFAYMFVCPKANVFFDNCLKEKCYYVLHRNLFKYTLKFFCFCFMSTLRVV